MTHALHLKAQSLVKNYLALERDLVAVLLEIDGKRLYHAWGYASLFQYVLSLGLTEAQVYTLITVTRKCAEVPALRAAVSVGTISIAKARRIAPVLEATPKDAGMNTAWLAKAETLTCKALELEVVKARPEEKPRDVLRAIGNGRAKLEVAISSELESKLRRLQDVLSQKRRTSVSLEATLDFAVGDTIERHDPLARARRAVARPAQSQPLARVVGKAIPAASLHAVRLRDQGECQARLPDGGVCGDARFIDVHHKILRSQGGGHELVNLTTLCWGHHKSKHRTLF